MNPQHEGLFEIAGAARHAPGRRSLAWEGSFQEYLAMVEARPGLARNAWQRITTAGDAGSVPSSEQDGLRQWKPSPIP